MFSTLIVMRHGESFANAMNILQGNSDKYGLTSKGIEEVEKTSRRLLSFPISKLISSPLKRTMETSLIIQNNIGFAKPIEIVEDLGGMNMGLLQGLTWEELKIKYGITKSTLNLGSPNPGDILRDGSKYNGESDEMYQHRVRKLFELLQKESSYNEEVILAVTHGLCMHTLIRFSGNNPYSSEFSNASVCAIVPTAEGRFQVYKV